MSSRKNKAQWLAEQCCQENGFIPCGANWYRCYGQGLLQVVSFNGLRSPREKRYTANGFYSLYEKIMWINFNYMGARRDVVPNITSTDLISTQKDLSQIDGVDDLELMRNYGFPLLNTIDTYGKLAHLREVLDIVTGQTIIMNASNKLIPYLLSGQSKKALAVIDAIVRQNHEAYEHHRAVMSNDDLERSRQKMEANLAPLLLMKEWILSSKWQEIVEFLQENYRKNANRLSAMDIPVPADPMSKLELIQLLTFPDPSIENAGDITLL